MHKENQGPRDSEGGSSRRHKHRAGMLRAIDKRLDQLLKFREQGQGVGKTPPHPTQADLRDKVLWLIKAVP